MSLRIAACLGVFAFASCGGPEVLPAELCRVWRNPDPAYANRYFELREAWVIFGTGRHTHDMFPIASVESESRGASTAYTVEYRANDGELVPLQLAYSPGPPEQLRIGSREDAWLPEAPASPPKGRSS